MKIFISGGCKNGKSYLAQSIARAQNLAQSQKTALTHDAAQPAASGLYYVATMRPYDSEDHERIARHRKEREGCGFTTIEQPYDIEKILDICGSGDSVLLDSLTALLANEMFLPDNCVNVHANEKINAALLQITAQLDNIVIVSDYIYGDAQQFDELTENYMKSLAMIDKTAATNCDVVLEACYTNIVVHKGKEMFEPLWSSWD